MAKMRFIVILAISMILTSNLTLWAEKSENASIRDDCKRVLLDFQNRFLNETPTMGSMKELMKQHDSDIRQLVLKYNYDSVKEVILETSKNLDSWVAIIVRDHIIGFENKIPNK